MPALPEQLQTAERARLFDAVERAAAQIGLAVFIVHVDAAPPVVVYASELLARMLGRGVEELVGRPPWDLVAPEQRDRVRELVARGPGAPPISVVVPVERPDGSRRTIEVGVARIATAGAELAVCYFRDATDEREVATALRSSQERFRTLIETAPDGVAISTRGRIALVNPAGARLLGATGPDQVHGRMITDYMSPEDAARARDRMAQVANGAALGPAECGVAGRDHTVEVHSVPCEWEGAPAILAFVRDVTERKRLGRELEHAARLAAVGTMAAAVAHEINNPLTYVRLSLERLDHQLRGLGASGEPLREHVRDALHGAARVAAIVRDLRAFARDDDDRPLPVDVVGVVESALKMVEHDLRHRARVVRRYAGRVPAVRASAGRLEQVMVNLLLNAIQALPAGDPTRDTITVTIEVRTPGELSIAVRDTGSGIAPEDRDRVFEPFFTTKSGDDGTGLGLMVCKRLVEAMRGRIALDTAAGGGTEVTLTLPADAADAVPAPPGAAAPTERRLLRILVVDDEPLVRRVVGMALAQHDHEVEEASTGEVALALVAERGFDVIVCDLMMPGMTGADLYRHVRDRVPGLERRIVLMTGGAFLPRAAAFLASVDNPRLDKPFTEAEVLAAVVAAAAR